MNRSSVVDGIAREVGGSDLLGHFHFIASAEDPLAWARWQNTIPALTTTTTIPF